MGDGTESIPHILKHCSTWNNKQNTMKTDAKFLEVAQDLGITPQELQAKILQQIATLPTEDIIQTYHSVDVLIATRHITQKQCMLRILRSHQSITNQQAYNMGITNPAYLVHQLQMSGHTIESRWAYPDRSPRNNHKVYTLIEQASCAAS